jgi:hypothetical protein
LLPYFPDVAVYSSNYSLKIKLSAHLKNNRVYNLKNPKEFLDSPVKTTVLSSYGNYPSPRYAICGFC